MIPTLLALCLTNTMPARAKIRFALTEDGPYGSYVRCAPDWGDYGSRRIGTQRAGGASHLFIQHQFMAIKWPGAHDVVSQDRPDRFEPCAASAAPLQPFMDSTIAPLWAILIGTLPIAQGLEELQNRVGAFHKNPEPG